LILSAAPAVRNLKHWSWGAENRVALTVKVMTLKSRCLFLPIEAVGIPLHPEVRAVGQDVRAVPALTAVPVIKQKQLVLRS